MSLSRQTELLAGSDWRVLHRAFSQINFNATDPVSINAALRSYIQVNYPESFNDWIVSSEFVAILDLLSWLAGTLAFKTDIAARENFIDTAEARESILRLARFLSYNPSRCQPATGILKITEVASDDEIYDSFGNNLANSRITWNDPNNANWFEQFTQVLDNAFVTTNPFGVPLAEGTVGNVATQLYRVNGLAAASSLGFSATVSGIGMDFEVCNGDYVSGSTLSERAPNPANALQFYYLNDSNGNTSNRTGFFLLFKQGSTSQRVFAINTPVQNQILDVNIDNINQDDVWVDTVDDRGQVVVNWKKVPAILNSNITYNNLAATQRNIFSVITRDNDQISIRFSDGNFGNAPVGNIAVTYRSSNGLQYQIKPSEISNITLPIEYVNNAGAAHTLYLTFSLFETISNASQAETIEQIRQRAPQVYATQNRMVSGEDYNTFPLASNLIVKLKAVNRVYSGQSRYIDLHDPTGTYRDLSLFADDGIFFRDRSDSYYEVPAILNRTAAQLVSGYIVPAINQYTTSNLIRDVLMQEVLTGKITAPTSPPLIWTTPQPGSLYTTTGWFNLSNAQVDNLIQPGAMLQFSIRGALVWVAVIDVSSSINAVPLGNTAGPVTLSQEVPKGTQVKRILPQALTVMPTEVIDAIESNLRSRNSFSLWYDYRTNGGRWVVKAPQTGFGNPVPKLATDDRTLLIMIVNRIGDLWRINSRGTRYVFESLRDVQWYNNGRRSLAQGSSQAVTDTISIMRINQNLHSDGRGFALSRPYDLTVDRLWSYADGTPEPRRTVVNLIDSNSDGYPDYPDTFFTVTSDDPLNTYLFWSSVANPPFEQPIYNVCGYETEAKRIADKPAIGTIGFQLTSSVSPVFDETFWVYSSTGWQQDTISYRMARGRGPNVAESWMTASSGTLSPFSDAINFHWKHYATADHRINPSSTNIVDVFVLTYSYDAAIRQWIGNGAPLASKPQPPSELDLKLAFANLETFKMFSDTIVWRAVRYKFLFGASADPSVQAQFKVIRFENSAISDGEIKSRIITAINTFFDVARWDFGETFFFTELAAYIHQQLVGLISSVVIVPLAASAAFGDGFEISCDADEIFISTAQVSDILLINTNTAINLRIS